jgi:hypothetical protein
MIVISSFIVVIQQPMVVFGGIEGELVFVNGKLAVICLQSLTSGMKIFNSVNE